LLKTGQGLRYKDFHSKGSGRRILSGIKGGDFFQYKNQYRIFKPVEITIKGGLMWKIEGRYEPIQVIIHINMKMSK
jgi:hypothetical protein